MSRLRSLDVHDAVRRSDVSTSRGTFVSWMCEPQDTSLPRGNVLLIPGFTGSKEDFAPLLPLLADAGWRVATYDQRGQFETRGAPDDDYSLEGFATDALHLAEEVFGGEEKVHLVGHSFGGLVAGVAAIEHGSCWASLTLMCSGPGAIPGDRAKQALAAAELVETQGLEAAWQAKQDDDLVRGVDEAEPPIEQFLHRRFLSNAPESLAAMSRHIGTAEDRTHHLAALDLPTAMLRGEADDAWPHPVQDALADALDTTVVVIADAAHSPAVEQPEATRDALVRIWLG